MAENGSAASGAQGTSLAHKGQEGKALWLKSLSTKGMKWMQSLEGLYSWRLVNKLCASTSLAPVSGAAGVFLLVLYFFRCRR